MQVARQENSIPLTYTDRERPLKKIDKINKNNNKNEVLEKERVPMNATTLELAWGRAGSAMTMQPCMYIPQVSGT
jgi:hypothetical protein